jgi:hypothetical protein
MASDSQRVLHEIELVAGGYRPEEMPGRLRQLVADFGRQQVEAAAEKVINHFEVVARVLEMHPPEYMNMPVDKLPYELRDWAAQKKRRAAELHQDLENFRAALAQAKV